MYLFGFIFDESCLQWQESCGEANGACWIYDSHLLARNLFIVLFVVRIVCVTCYSLALMFYRQPPDNDDTNTEYISLDG